MSPSVLIRVPLARQAASYTCGVACVQSVLGYSGYSLRQDVLADEMGSTYDNGTDPSAIISILNSYGLGAELRQGMSIDDVKTCIDQGQPVICAIQAWDERSDVDYVDEWDDGHYIVAVGYDDTRMYFMDPSTLGNYTYIDNDSFEARWHDTTAGQQFVHMGIVCTQCTQAYDPDAYMSLD